MRWVFLNGELVDSNLARIPALDRGLLYGHGLFETMRAYNGKVFRLAAHYDRLREGAGLLGIDLQHSLASLEEAVSALLERNGELDVALRLTVTADRTVLLVSRPISGYPPELYKRGMSVATAAIQRNETSPLSGVKSLNYLDSLLARDGARGGGFDEALLLNTRGLVAEGTASNLFMATPGRQLITPTIGSGALGGITRRVVLELARADGLDAVEADVRLSALRRAEEAFLTNSVMEVMPLTRLNGAPIALGQPGLLTLRLRDLYREKALQETSASADATSGESTL